MTAGGSSTDHDACAGFSAPGHDRRNGQCFLWKMTAGVWSLATETLEVPYKNVSAVCQDETVNAA